MSINWKKRGPLLTEKETGQEPSLDHIIRSYYRDRIDNDFQAIKAAKAYMDKYE